MGRLRKIKIKDSEVKESYEIPMIESSEPQIYVPEPASPDVKPEETKVVAEETDKFSQKNLGRRILFEKGEFAAESYRRNMIFNENSYFNHPVTSEADYLSSFTSNPEKFSAENQAPKSYSQSYQEEIYNQPASMPSSHVIDERSDGYGYNNVYNQQAEEYSVVEEQSFPDYNLGDEAETYSDDDYSVRGAENNYQNRDDYSSQPSAARNIASFSENSEEKEEFTSPEVNSEPEPFKSDKLFHNESTPVNETDDRFIQKERERSRSELFDSDDDEDDILSVGTERSGRTERVDRSENINTVRSERSVPQVDLGRGVQRKPEEPKRVERRAEPIPEQPEKVEEKPKHVWQKYVRPTLDLLDDYPENSNVNTGEIEDNKRTIVQALERYKIASEVANVTIGPSITRYDVIIQDKTNIKRSLGYRDAIAMELMKENVTAYLNYSKGALSIEVPNNQRAIVGLKTMLASQKFINSKRNSLTFALGKNVEGEVVCPDITKMPHLLVAGTTGSGKSICLSALLVSLL